MTEEKLSQVANDWLCIGERGKSAEAMFEHLLGHRLQGRTDCPSDTDDFARCVLLERWVPEIRDRLPRMHTLSPEWGRIVMAWGGIIAACVAENPEWPHSGKRYLAQGNAILGRAVIGARPATTQAEAEAKGLTFSASASRYTARP
jgi:hypothetical protein